jgi:hypothetical protein
MIIKLSLPKNCLIKVKRKDEVSFGDHLYQYDFSQTISINIADKLAIKPANIFQSLVKIINQTIKKGELLAKKKGLFRTKKLYSDYDGIIKEINHVTGEVIIIQDKCSKKVVRSNFKGLIDDYNKNYLTVDIKNGKPFALKDVNKDGGGEVFYFQNESLFFQISEEDLKDKIIIIEDLKTHLESKCEALGAKGFVFLKGQPSTNLPYAKIKNIDDYQQICQLQKKYIIFSKEDRIGIVYD